MQLSERVRALIRALLVEGRIGDLGISSSVDEVQRLASAPEATAPWSRTNKQPAILKYGWVQLFLDEASARVEGVGIYPTLSIDDHGVLVDPGFAAFLLEAQPFDVADIVQGCSIVADAFYEHLGTARYDGERFELVPADYISVCVDGGGEAVFHAGSPPPWRLQKMLFFRNVQRVAEIPTVF